MSTWADLREELDRWQAAGQTADFWWRDDDAGEIAPAFERLLEIAGRTRTPLAVAVIPATATRALARRLLDSPVAAVLQHGFAHRNHAPAGEKKAELGADRPLEAILEELSQGRERLADLFAGAPVHTLVPPWNRISEQVTAALPTLGLSGLSTFAPRASGQPVPGLCQVNAHADLIDWKGSRGFAGEAQVLGQIVGHLADRRQGRADPGEPTGLLTHHLDHDAACWTFLEAFLEETRSHSACRWRAAAEIFPAS